MANSRSATLSGGVTDGSTAVSRLRIATAMDHVVDGPEGTGTLTESHPDLARMTVAVELDPGQRLRLVSRGERPVQPRA